MSELSEKLLKIAGANAKQQEVECFLDTGFAPLNKILSGSYKGGLPVGRLVEMYSPPSCGKTAVATSAMIHAQRLGGIPIFQDHEHSFDIGQAVNLGLDLDAAWIYKTPETFEESVDEIVQIAKEVRGQKLIDPKAPMIAVFDSLASMVPRSKFFDAKGKEKSSTDYSMHDNTALARATSAAFPALVGFAQKYNICLLFLNQTRTALGVTHGDATTTPGGNAPEFYASARISLTRSMIKDGQDIVGQSIRAYTKKNKVVRPFQEAHWRFMFREDGTGYFDTVRSTLEYMKDIGLIESAGSRVTWEGKSLYMSQVAEAIELEGRLPDLLEMLYKHEAATA